MNNNSNTTDSPYSPPRGEQKKRGAMSAPTSKDAVEPESEEKRVKGSIADFSNSWEPPDNCDQYAAKLLKEMHMPDVVKQQGNLPDYVSEADHKSHWKRMGFSQLSTYEHDENSGIRISNIKMHIQKDD